MALQQPYEIQVDAASVRTDTDVYSRDGEKLGIVSDVWAHIPPYGLVSRSSFALADYGPVRGSARLFERAEGYLQVRTSRGVRREGEVDLFIPLDAVHDVVAGEALLLEERNDACRELYAARPDGL
jgi:hypothetical protein